MARPSLELDLWVRLWALAIVVDTAINGRGDTAHGLILTCAAFSCVYAGVTALSVLSVSYLSVLITTRFADWAVHEYIAAAVHLCVVACCAACLLHRSRLPEAEELATLLRAPLRMIAAAIGFAGLAKLNRDFVDARISCAGVYYLWVREWPGLSFLPTSDLAKRAVIAFTIAVELGAPVLWLFRRTRLFGLGCMWLLTLGMVLNTRSVYFEFIGLFWACSLWWLEPNVLRRTAERLGAWSSRARSWLPSLGAPAQVDTLVKVGAAACLTGLAWQGRERLGDPPWTLSWLLPPVVLVCVVSATALHTALAAHGDIGTMPSGRTCAGGYRWLVFCVPTLLWMMELSVYVGLPHQPALTMAANMSTARGYSNHLLSGSLPALPAFAPVVIESSTLPGLRRKDHLSLLQLRHLVAKHPDSKVRGHLVESGETLAITDADQARSFGRRSRLVTWLRLRTYRPDLGKILCDKPEPGESKASTYRRMRERLIASSN